MKMESTTIAAWVLGVIGVAMFATGLILTTARKPEPAPTATQWSEWDADTPPKLGPKVLTAEGWSPVPPAGTYLTTEPSPASPTFEEVLARPGAVVGNVIVSEKMLVPKPFPDTDTGAGTLTVNSTITIPGHHVITQAEAEEVMVIIRDSLYAHYFALEFYETAAKTMTKPEEQSAVWENIRRVAGNGKRLIEFEAKWRKRVEEGKP